MPRKKARDAKAEEDATRRARIRYVLRNPTFRKEFNDLRRRVPTLHDGVERMLEVWKVAEKWKVPSLLRHAPLFHWKRDDFRKLLSMPSDFRESFLGHDSELWKPFSEHDALELSSETLPVFENILTADVGDPRLVGDVSSAVEGSTLILWVDMASDRPVDSLLALVEKELRRFAKERPRGRRRLDKTDFYLQVFDLAELGETFKAIAAKLQGRVSTVKSAYLTASRNVFGLSGRPAKKALPLASFDFAGHCETCPKCGKAQRPEEFCRKALLYAHQDQRGQRERPGYDTVMERTYKDG